MNQVKRSFFTIVYCAIFCIVNLIPNNTSASNRLNMGDLSSNASYEIKKYTPLLNYLKSNKINTGKIFVYKNIEIAFNNLKSEEFDFIFSTPATAIKFMDEAGAVPILIALKGGVKRYNSVIFVKKDSPIHSLSELKGKVIAFEREYSTSSYYLPSNILRNAGMELQYSRKPIPGKIAYYFTKEDVNTVVQVKAGKRAHAGGIQKYFLDRHPDFELFRILAESPYVPRMVVMVRKGFDYAEFKKILLKMKDDPAAQNTLKHMHFTGFCKFEGDPVQIMDTMVRKAVEIKHDDL